MPLYGRKKIRINGRKGNDTFRLRKRSVNIEAPVIHKPPLLPYVFDNPKVVHPHIWGKLFYNVE
jgi:hypothetical protein